MVSIQILILFSFMFTEILSRLETKSFGCTCGKDPNNKFEERDRIVWKSPRLTGGGFVEYRNPWFVFIEFKEKGSSRSYRCGGTLLNQRWALTAAHCFCNYKNAKYQCEWSKKKRRLELNYNVQEYATVYFGINNALVARVNSKRFRGIKKVIIHEGFNLTDGNSYNDLALLKFSRTFHKKDWNWNTTRHDAIYPICLPDSSYNEVGKISFVTGFGLETQDTCLTNGKGPEIYSTCASGSIMTHKGKTTKIKHYNETIRGFKGWVPGLYGCINGNAPTKLDLPCYGYNYHNKNNEKFLGDEKNEGIDEIVLVPADRSIEPRACYHTRTDTTKIGIKNNKAEASIGWCGICIQNAKEKTPGYCGPGAGESEANFVELTGDSGWGYCIKDCLKSGGQWSTHKLKTVSQNILSSFECKKLLKGIKSKKTLDASKQICAGHKIQLGTPPFYEYEGAGIQIKFKKIDPIKGYRSPRENLVPGLDFMVGGKTSCQGDSGGPMWTKEGKAEGDELGYLVGVVSARARVGNCANLNNPEIYTKIKHYLSWIKKHASDGKCTSTTSQRRKRRKGRRRSREMRRNRRRRSRG